MAEVIIVDDEHGGGELVADHIAGLIRRRPATVLGLATGSTPLPVYRALQSRAQGLDMTAVRGFALDEYVGIEPEHPQSYRSVITREVTEPLGLDPELVHVPNGSLETIDHAGSEYEAAITEAGGIDLQIVGIGTEGHIGFNEPSSSLASRTRLKTLTRQTREDNARFFDSMEDVPRRCITQGIGTILEARHLVLLAFGAHKAEAVSGAVEGPVTASLPGSALQLHQHVTVVVDEAAAAHLRFAEYYRDVWENKPAWQGI